MLETTNKATRTIGAPAKDIFEVLANPDRHKDTDGSGMVQNAENPQRLEKVGDTFTMNMNYDGNDYQTYNEVFAFEEGRVIGWKNVKNITSGAEAGSKWLYELEPKDEGHTEVTLTYDRSDIADEKVREGTGNFNDEFLDNSLSNLAQALA